MLNWIKNVWGRTRPDRRQFEIMIGVELFWLGWPIEAAAAEAQRVLRDFLKGERIAFGDAQYDWTRTGARDLAREMSGTER